jgi:hypothetical protein
MQAESFKEFAILIPAPTVPRVSGCSGEPCGASLHQEEHQPAPDVKSLIYQQPVGFQRITCLFS